MADNQRFKFHGHAAALSGRIVRVGEGTKAKFIKNAFIDLPAAALPATGGRSSAPRSRKNLTDPVVRTFVRFENASVSSEGVYEEAKGHFEVTQGKRASNTLTPVTKVSADVRGLDIGLKGNVRMTIKRVRGGFTSKKNMAAGESGIQLTRETGFDGNSVTFVDEKGKPYILTVGIAKELFDTHDTFSAITAAPNAALARTDDGAAHGTVVKPLRWKGREFPGSAIDPERPNTVSIPGFGQVSFGEITMTPQSRRLTMVRLDLGSPIGGDCACADVMDNGGGSL
jgi:hypothetical protein